MTECISGIYQVRNILNEKIYLGSAEVFAERWSRHKTAARGKTHHSIKFQRAWDKNDEEVFVFEIIEYVEDLDKLLEREQHYLDLWKPYETGYNICKNAASRKGVKSSLETRAKISAANKGQKPSALAIERGIASRKAKGVSVETRAKISAANTGRACKEETKVKIANAQKGKKHSPERIAKNSAAQKIRIRKPHTMESRAKMSASMKGLPKSEEAKINIRAARMAYLARQSEAAISSIPKEDTTN